MALTWATVVLLGGLIDDLSTWDFYLMSALLVVESLRLFVVQIFTQLVSGILYREKTDPAEFEFTDKQPKLVSILSYLGQALNGGIAIGCLFLTFYRIGIRGSPPFSSDEGANHMVASLWIFYMIVILNFIIAILSAALHLLFRLLQGEIDTSSGDEHANSLATLLHLLFRLLQGKIDTSSGDEHANSLTTFYDKIYSTAIEDGMSKGREVDLLDFAFGKIASDLKRKIRPLIVKTLNKEMITYMYENNGVAMACQYLKGEDLWKRIAAANLAGFWCKENRMDTKQELFWCLRERVFCAGDEADASLNSIESLARHWSLEENDRPHPFLVDIPGGGNVLDTIVNLVLMETRSSILFRVRAFEACCRDRRVVEHLYRQVDPHSEQPMYKQEIGGLLVQLIEKEVRPSSGQERGSVTVNGECLAKFSNSNLAKLCIKLAVLLSPKGENLRSVARFYCARALMLLVKHCDDEIQERAVADALKRWLETSIVFGKHSYYAKADMEAAERVRAWAGLEALKWESVMVRDIENRSKVMEIEDKTRILQEVRGLSEAASSSRSV
ncbi:hypothetical protein KP509_38G017400 [Ceratopteris richardii]|nr:hypothetical protein KP509_38G017400 [Ceratopteris richardii]